MSQPKRSGQIGPQLNSSGTAGVGSGTTQRSTKEVRAARTITLPQVGKPWNEADVAGLSRDAYLSEDEIVPRM